MLTDFAALRIFYLPFALFTGAWIWIDANARIGNGWFWGLLTMTAPPLGIPLYYGTLLVRHLRDVHTQDQYTAERAENERVRRIYTAQGELGRQKLLAQAEAGGGTLFGPAPRQPHSGRQHFTDQRAESLLRDQQLEEAFEYLADLYQTAAAAEDDRAQETYLHYLNQIPGAITRLFGDPPPPPPAARRGFD